MKESPEQNVQSYGVAGHQRLIPTNTYKRAKNLETNITFHAEIHIFIRV